MVARRHLRLGFVAVLLTAGMVVGLGLVQGGSASTLTGRLDLAATDEGAKVAPEASGMTVIATDASQWGPGTSENPRSTSQLVAIRSNGTVAYFDGAHDRYWDVDPVEGGSRTVEYAFSDHLEGDACPTGDRHEAHAVSEDTWDTYDRESDACTRNGFERVDLSTGEVTRVWSAVTPGKTDSRYHDIDRIGQNRIVVADIFFDRVFTVDTRTGQVDPVWNASDTFARESGGPYPADWTHINDVEVLGDGRYMVDLRNQDQVVFVEDGEYQDEWTLGSDGNHSRLYEQHNPDYIPATNGGPAVIVADSENNRVLEFQRENGNWTQTWRWQDSRLQWPRDADRLPNGHTLITDSNGNRVFEIDEQGEKVWSVPVAFPYEAERLGTGDESAGGPSVQAIENGTLTTGSGGFWVWFKGLLPGKYLNGLMYLTPVWMGLAEVIALAVLVLAGLSWAAVELRWAIDDRRLLATR
ncbi:arylsulfotransferase family protein [Halobacteriales archaeon Cl-PHB]